MNPPAPPIVRGIAPPPVPLAPPAAAPPPPVPVVPPQPPVPSQQRGTASLPAATGALLTDHDSQGTVYETREPAGELRDNRSPLATGTEVRSYTITARLGRGGYGITYRARHTTKGNAVVIKEHMPLGMATREPGSSEVFFPTSRDEARFHETMAEFLEEITVLRALEYPGIVPIIDSFEANDTAYYVMPFIAGTTLRAPEKISLDAHQLRLRARRTKRLLHDLLGTLEYMEQHHIVHRDIKPDNILIANDGQPVLLDFGSARQLRPGKVFSNVYTPDFCAPEQATATSDDEMSAALGPWTDIYSLGATFYYLISHLVPPTAEMRIYSTPDPYKPLASRPDLREIYGMEFLAGIDRALELHATDRWQSATAWRESLEESTTEIPPRVMRNIRIFGSLALLVLLVVSGLAIYAFSERRQLRAAYNSGLNFTESILFDFSTELTNIPGSSYLQRTLSANLQKYLTSMRDLPVGQDGRLDRSMAAAWFNLGHMHLSLGNLNNARAALQRAQELESMICYKFPDDQRFRYELARTHLAQAELFNRINDSDDSAQHADAAVRILEDLYARYPDNPNYGSSLGEALAFKTFYLRHMGHHGARKEVLDRLVPLYRNLVAHFPRHVPSAEGLGHALHYRGRYAKEMEDYADASKHLSESYKIFTHLAENYPNYLSIKKGLAQVLHTMGDMYYYQSLREVDPESKAALSRRASDTLKEHIALVHELRRLDATHMDYLYLECRALAQVANLLLLRGEPNEAEAQVRSILEKVELLLLKEPDNSEYISVKALALCSLALAHNLTDRHRAKAPEELAESLHLLNSHISRFKCAPEILLVAKMEVLTHTGRIALLHGKHEQALSALNEADAMLNNLMRDTASPTARQKIYRSFIRQLIDDARQGNAPTSLLQISTGQLSSS